MISTPRKKNCTHNASIILKRSSTYARARANERKIVTILPDISCYITHYIWWGLRENQVSGVGPGGPVAIGIPPPVLILDSGGPLAIGIPPPMLILGFA